MHKQTESLVLIGCRYKSQPRQQLAVDVAKPLQAAPPAGSQHTAQAGTHGRIASPPWNLFTSKSSYSPAAFILPASRSTWPAELHNKFIREETRGFSFPTRRRSSNFFWIAAELLVILVATPTSPHHVLDANRRQHGRTYNIGSAAGPAQGSSGFEQGIWRGNN